MRIKSTVTINGCKTISQLPDAWKSDDIIALLDELGYTDSFSTADAEEMLYMALSDQEPEESAAILLKYRLGQSLNDGQIQQLSHEMQEDKVSEEYADIFLHRPLFEINQLLYKAYNGRFPNCQGMVVDMNLSIKGHLDLIESDQLSEVIIKSILPALDDHSLIQRLYDEILDKEIEFPDAAGIIWKSKAERIDQDKWKIIFYSSEYWLQDLAKNAAYETVLLMADEEDKED